MNYIEHTKTWDFYSDMVVNKSVFILLYESYMSTEDRMNGLYMDLIVCLDIRYQRLWFFVWFFVGSDMIISDIEVRSDIIMSESVIDFIVRLLDLGLYLSRVHFIFHIYISWIWSQALDEHLSETNMYIPDSPNGTLHK